jgi:hypothetical protein
MNAENAAALVYQCDIVGPSPFCLLSSRSFVTTIDTCFTAVSSYATHASQCHIHAAPNHPRNFLPTSSPLSLIHRSTRAIQCASSGVCVLFSHFYSCLCSCSRLHRQHADSIPHQRLQRAGQETSGAHISMCACVDVCTCMCFRWTFCYRTALP